MDSIVLTLQLGRDDAKKGGKLDMRQGRQCKGEIRKDVFLEICGQIYLNLKLKSKAGLKSVVV